MNDDDRERLIEIENSAKKLDGLKYKYELAKVEAKMAREEWECEAEKHMELCRSCIESQEIADRPLLRAVEEKSGFNLVTGHALARDQIERATDMARAEYENRTSKPSKKREVAP